MSNRFQSKKVMSNRQPEENSVSDQDIEGQLSKDRGVDSGENKDLLEESNKTILATIQTYLHLHPEKSFLQIWNTIFVVSCVVAVSLDPLFLYVPVIDEVKKCIELDNTLRIVTISSRAVTDLIYLLNAILQFYIDNVTQKLRSPVTDASKTARTRRYLRLQGYLLIDILAILPLPHVVIPLLFIKMGGSNYSNTRILLDSAILFQYFPRVLRLYLSRKVLTESVTNVVIIIWAKAAFKFALHILASNVVGACWYLFSIEREISCWQIACESHIGCVRSSFNCDTSLGNYTFLNDFCTVNTTDTRETMLIDFGIFFEALQSGILKSRDFPQKFLHCFWWGLRNMSSLGQNLQTSTYFWENCFAVFISIFGLLVFLSLIGTLQTFIQLETERLKNTYIEKKEIRWKTKVKQGEISLWMSRHNLPDDLKNNILTSVKGIMKNSPDIDVKNPLPYLPAKFRKKIQHKLCLTLLKKVPMFENLNEQQLHAMCEHLKPVVYTEKSYIVRQGEPVVEILFIMRGKLLATTIIGGRTDFFESEYLKAGDLCGQELVTLCLDPSSSMLPISTRTVQAFSEVEAFALKADDLKFVASNDEQLIWTACIIQAAWRRHCKRNCEKSHRVAENSIRAVNDMCLCKDTCHPKESHPRRLGSW